MRLRTQKKACHRDAPATTMYRVLGRLAGPKAEAVVVGSANGAEGIRTLDPLNANQVLSQLSYRPEVRALLVLGPPQN